MGELVGIASTTNLVRPLYPDLVSVAATDPRQDYSGLYPEEAKFIARAAPQRRREFTAGRVAARRAMAALGLEGAPIKVGFDRSPVWPEGLVGGISHTDQVCLAAIAQKTDLGSIGLDVEAATPLLPDLWSTVLTPADQSLVRSFRKSERGLIAKLIFSAKECAYKCQYALSRKLFGFEMMEITLDMETRRFWAVFTQDVPPFSRGEGLMGNFVMSDGIIATGMVLEAQVAEARVGTPASMSTA